MATIDKHPENTMENGMSPEDLAVKIDLLRQMFGTTLLQETRTGVSENQVFIEDWKTMNKN